MANNLRSMPPAMHRLSQEMLERCSDASKFGWRHVDVLAEDSPKDELEACLWGCAVVLGVLAADVFESVILLLDANHIRGGNILSRALVDYDTKLRYDIVQFRKWCQKYGKSKAPLEEV